MSRRSNMTNDELMQIIRALVLKFIPAPEKEGNPRTVVVNSEPNTDAVLFYDGLGEGDIVVSVEPAKSYPEGWYTAYTPAYLRTIPLWTDGSGRWWNTREDRELSKIPSMTTWQLSGIERIVQGELDE